MHEEQDGAFDRWEGRTESARRASEAEENALHLALLERDFLDDPQDPRTLYYLGASSPSHEFRSRSKPFPSSSWLWLHSDCPVPLERALVVRQIA